MKPYQKRILWKIFQINYEVAIASEIEKNYDVEEGWQEFNPDVQYIEAI